MAIPVKEEVIYDAAIIEEFENAVNGLAEDAKIIIDRYVLEYTSSKGFIRLIGMQHAEIKSRNCVLNTTSDGFALNCNGNIRFGSRLIVNNKVYNVSDFIEFLRRGFRELLLKKII
jgi:hypothetical protein